MSTKVYELLHRITFDDNVSNAVVIFTGRHSYEVFSEESVWFVGTKDMCHELKIYLSY